MNLYEINAEINALIENGTDPDTGELMIDQAALEALQLERDVQIENIALYIKNLNAEASAIKEEETILAQRRTVALNKAERLSNFLSSVINGESFSSPKVAISYRKSSAVDIEDGFIEWAMNNAADLLRYKEPEADKKAIAQFFKDGGETPYAKIVYRSSMTIK